MGGALVAHQLGADHTVSPNAAEILSPADLDADSIGVVHADQLTSDVVASVRVLWIHRCAMHSISGAHIQTLLDQGIAVGLLEGTVADFQQQFGVAIDNPSFIRPGTGRPVFVLVQTHACVRRTGASTKSDWLIRSAFVAASQEALAFECQATPDVVPPTN